MNRWVYATAQIPDQIQQKIENHFRSLSLHFVHYDFVRIHRTVEVAHAMVARLAGTLHDMDWILQLIDANAPKPNRTETCMKKILNWDAADKLPQWAQDQLGDNILLIHESRMEYDKFISVLALLV